MLLEYLRIYLKQQIKDMIANILEALKIAESNNELILIAKGKYKYPSSFKELFKQFKNQK
jgi:hypothetical protein